MHMSSPTSIDVLSAAADLPAAEWDACAGTGNPFVSHAFITSLEASGSACARTGWLPAHLVLRHHSGKVDGIMPAYRKSHSQGEYVFDHGWADAFERAGGRYYPKLQCAVPFSPVPGPRLLLRDPAAAPQLLAGAAMLAEKAKLSSVHATFIRADQVELFRQAGWLIRLDQQFHWTNRRYGNFDDFLGSLSSRKRKMIRNERVQALDNGVVIERISGTDIKPEHWNALWQFYNDTGRRKWGQPYLTREFFDLIGAAAAEKVLLVLAKRGERYVAGAMNMIGADTLYGRYWGCTEDHPYLHFEVCYYQAIDYAIAHGLTRVEAGAQGAHKLARGYEPTATYSAHWIVHPGFRVAIADYLERERAQVEADIDYLGTRTPFRKVSDERD